MIDDLFDTPEKRAAAIASFQGLLLTPGWRLHCQILDKNIELLTKQILNRQEGQTEADMDRLRDRRSVLVDERDYPERMITELSKVEDEEVNLDPYDNVPEELDNT